MNNVQLSPHFKLSEFTKSSTATVRHIDNTPNDEQVKNLKALCENVLEPLRQHFNVPIIIGSGFRCPKLNAAVGGVKTVSTKQVRQQTLVRQAHQPPWQD